MRYVLDSSVGLKFVLSEVDSARAVRLRDEYRNGVHELIAPDIYTPEVANGLASAERQRRIQSGEAIVFLHDLILNSPAIHPSVPLLARAVEISVAHRQAVYDCLYLALAEREKCELVTADDQFARQMRASFPFVVSLGTLP
jgi:predicted nucleic acid-binding protein